MCVCVFVRACTPVSDEASSRVMNRVLLVGFAPRRCVYITVLINRDRSSSSQRQNDMSLPTGMFYSGDIKIVISQPISVSGFPVSVCRSLINVFVADLEYRLARFLVITQCKPDTFWPQLLRDYK